MEDEYKTMLECEALRREARAYWPTKVLQLLAAAVAIYSSVVVLPQQIVEARSNISDERSRLEAEQQELEQAELRVRNDQRQVRIEIEELSKERTALEAQRKDVDEMLENAQRENEKASRRAMELAKKDSITEDQLKELETAKSRLNQIIEAERQQVRDITDQLVLVEGQLEKEREYAEARAAKFEELRPEIWREQIVLSIAEKILANGGYYNGIVYLSPEIKKEKLENALSVNQISSGEDIVALVDLTLTGSAKKNIVFGEDAVFYQARGGESSIPYRDIDEDSVRANSSTKLEINGQEVTIIGGDLSAGAVRDVMLDLAERIERLDQQIESS